MKVLLIGVDLAWGEKKHDGVCLLEWNGNFGSVLGFGYPRGDRELMELIRGWGKGYRSVFVTVDAPIVCPNRTGTRPVDRLTHRMFHKEHAACHPANSTKCPRPPRLARLGERWSKPVEDRTDALFCVLIGLWHWMHRGKKSQVIGDRETGFILLPEPVLGSTSPGL